MDFLYKELGSILQGRSNKKRRLEFLKTLLKVLEPVFEKNKNFVVGANELVNQLRQHLISNLSKLNLFALGDNIHFNRLAEELVIYADKYGDGSERQYKAISSIIALQYSLNEICRRQLRKL